VSSMIFDFIPLVIFLFLSWIFFFKDRNKIKSNISEIRLKKNGTLIANQVVGAYKTIDRMVGLTNTASMNSNEALFIKPARTIHMQGMSFPIDAVFTDRDLRVTKLFKNLKPNSGLQFLGGAKAKAVIELAAGAIDRHQIRVGDIIDLNFC
jgi:uncharacterized protein